MPETEEQKKAREAEEAAAEAAAEADAKLNGAIKSHMKRLQKEMTAEFSKSIGEQIAKALETIKPAAPVEEPKDDKDKKGGKADPVVAKLQEELERVKAKQKEAEDKARAVEDRERKSNTRSTLKAALEEKGIKGRRADAAIALMESEGALTFTEDGQPVLTIKRSRSKGAAAEALEFDDLAAGVEDWSKTGDAAEFLPAPGSTKTGRTETRGAGTQQQTNGAQKARKTYDAPALTEEEAARRTAEDLAARGVDFDSIFDS